MHPPESHAASRHDRHLSGRDSGGKSERMVVVVRVRHLTERERQLCALRYPHRLHIGYSCVEAAASDVIVFDPDSPAHRSCGRRYAFDRVFDATTTNEEVYADSVEPLLAGLLDGYNATCFAYGMTGAGKTYTMMGSERVQGLSFMAVGDLFSRIESLNADCAVHASYLEIYNEKVKDLLGKDQDKRHDIVEDPEHGVLVTDLTEYLVGNVSDLQTLMALGCEKRTKASTASNVVSSRSHAILLITVRRRQGDESRQFVTVGKLALIDLAGSERAAPSDSHSASRGARLQEGANINRSLLALGNCITILGSGGGGGRSGRERKHVPYRDSKLTRLLKDSLGGNTRTVMIGNVSPASTCYEEVVSTLKYATRARNISRFVTRNAVVVDPAHPPRAMHPTLNALKSDIAQLRTQLVVRRCEEDGIRACPPDAGRYFRPVPVAVRPAVVLHHPAPEEAGGGLSQVRSVISSCRALHDALCLDESIASPGGRSASDEGSGETETDEALAATQQQEHLHSSSSSMLFVATQVTHQQQQQQQHRVSACVEVGMASLLSGDTSAAQLHPAKCGVLEADEADDWRRVHELLGGAPQGGVLEEEEVEVVVQPGVAVAAERGGGAAVEPRGGAVQAEVLPKWRAAAANVLAVGSAPRPVSDKLNVRPQERGGWRVNGLDV